MKRMTIGVRLESLGLPLRKALTEASRIGAAGVQVDAAGDLHPDQLSLTGRREFKNLLRVYNLSLTALACPLRHSLDAAEKQEGKACRDALNTLAKQVDKDVSGAKDPERVKAMSAAIKDLAKATK